MFSVHRFDANLCSGDSTNTQTGLHSVLQKSQERAKRKYASINSDENFITSNGETLEEKRARKAQAKIEKRERKARKRDGIDDESPRESATIESVPTTIESMPIVDVEAADIPKVGSKGSQEVAEEDSDAQSTAEMDNVTTNDLLDQIETSAESSAECPPSPQTDCSVMDNLAPPVSVEESVTRWGVSADIAADLLEEGITEYFPVQAAVIPVLLRHAQVHPFAPPRDICVSAPTGSGKVSIWRDCAEALA